MIESDLLWMTALIFTPTVFALLILFVPSGKDEVMRLARHARYGRHPGTQHHRLYGLS